jgi:uncharacterized protein (TIGR00255 family)
MTGFGKVEKLLPTKKIGVEIRSLNSKQLDLSIKLPAIYRSFEAEVRNLVSKVLQRGKVELYVTVESTAVETSAHINKEQFKAYCQQLQEALAYAGVEASSDSMMQAALRMPDVVSSSSEQVTEAEHTALTEAVTEAVAHLDAFRTQEGAILIADLLHRVEKIETYRDEIIPYEKARVENIKNRIRDNIAQLKVDVDSNRLEQEMIFYIEKLDITEEKVRLTNHCRYFREVAAEEEAPGRKLGFIAQEMGREINTLGSKANESQMQILVVKMKDELEKIKEQVLNIL